MNGTDFISLIHFVVLAGAALRLQSVYARFRPVSVTQRCDPSVCVAAIAVGRLERVNSRCRPLSGH